MMHTPTGGLHTLYTIPYQRHFRSHIDVLEGHQTSQNSTLKVTNGCSNKPLEAHLVWLLRGRSDNFGVADAIKCEIMAHHPQACLPRWLGLA